jgi:glycosyltransferase involved in cell wall biosynthesis
MRNLPHYGIQPFAVVLDDGPLIGWLQADGVPHIRLPHPRLRQMGGVVALLMRMRRLMQRHGIEVVFSNMTKAHVYGGAAALMAGRPAVWWQRSVPAAKAIERLAAFVPAAAVVASSDFAIAAQGALRSGQRLRKVYPGVDVEAIARRAGSGASVRTLQQWQDKAIVGIVGRLEHWKGQDVFLRAASQIAPAFPDARFLVVGGTTHGFEGSYPDQVRALAATLGIADRVHFTGQLDDVFGWLDAMDVVVHASHSEAFGRVVVEAMALGKAVVATNLGGPSEIVEDGRSGLLIPPKDPAAMAAALAALLGCPHRRAALGAQARERAFVFTERRSAQSLAAVLREVRRTPAGTRAGAQLPSSR